MAGLGLGLALGCLVARPNDDHCSHLEGDRTCAERYPGDRTFCRTCGHAPGRDGCVDERPDDDCYSPCGGGTRFHDDPSCLDASTGSSGGGSTTGEPTTTGATLLASGFGSGSESTTGPLLCTSDDECSDVAAPFCEPKSGECVACNVTADPDAACAGIDPMAPLCVDGACVQCTAAAPEACIGKTPVCDDATSTCVPCTGHDQCAGGAACNLFVGVCLPADAVVHVGPGEAFSSLGEAIGSFAAGAEGTLVVYAGPSYDEAATVGGGRVLAFLAAEIDLRPTDDGTSDHAGADVP